MHGILTLRYVGILVKATLMRSLEVNFLRFLCKLSNFFGSKLAWDFLSKILFGDHPLWIEYSPKVLDLPARLLILLNHPCDLFLSEPRSFNFTYRLSCWNHYACCGVGDLGLG
jgi:hypothetical protein